jgi:hypothetical protein
MKKYWTVDWTEYYIQMPIFADSWDKQIVSLHKWKHLVTLHGYVSVFVS